VKATVIPVIKGSTRTIKNHSDSTSATHQESTKAENYNKQLHWALRTYFRK